jgi:hypothetical protein
MKVTDKKLLECFHDTPSDIVFWAFRYFLGRQTIATCMFAEDLAKAWQFLDNRTQQLIKKELNEAFLRDDEDRIRKQNGEKVYGFTLGWDCDREAWQKVKDAYENQKID